MNREKRPFKMQDFLSSVQYTNKPVAPTVDKQSEDMKSRQSNFDEEELDLDSCKKDVKNQSITPPTTEHFPPSEPQETLETLERNNEYLPEEKNYSFTDVFSNQSVIHLNEPLATSSKNLSPEKDRLTLEHEARIDPIGDELSEKSDESEEVVDIALEFDVKQMQTQIYQLTKVLFWEYKFW